MKIHKLLLATDLSEQARHSYGHAASLAAAFGAKLDVLHVDELAEIGLHTAAGLSEYLGAMSDLREQRLVALDRDMTRLGADYELHQMAGSPSQAILGFADDQDTDLIVIAKHGGGRRMRHLFMGLTAKRLVRHARVPVLVVPVPHGGPADVAAPHTYDELLTATDFSYASQRGLLAALEIARQLDGRVHLVHVANVPSYLPGQPGGAPTDRLAWLREAHRAELDSLREELADPRLTTEVDLGPGPAERLAHLAEERDASLVVIPSEGKGALRKVLFGSTTERLLGLSAQPVLVLPREFLDRPWTVGR